MANPFVKGWRYLMALFGARIDQYADPKVQIQQAIEEAQRQHQMLVQQAAAVIGNQRQLEMKLSRQMEEVERLQGMARQAIVLADRERGAGNEAEASKYESTAQMLATQLVSGEQSMEDLKTLHDQALSAAGQARKAVENNSMVLQQRIAERTKLLSQLEQAKMQERVAQSLESMSSLTAPKDTPSLDEVREKIERRYANAMGRAELAANSVEGRMLEVQKSTLDMAGTSRLEQIRASMAGEQLAAGSSQPAVGQAAAAQPAAAQTGPQADPAGVARLDEIRASMAKDKRTGDSTAAG
jgi:phage shock protein A